jgi:hypothetical protein
MKISYCLRKKLGRVNLQGSHGYVELYKNLVECFSHEFRRYKNTLYSHISTETFAKLFLVEEKNQEIDRQSIKYWLQLRVETVVNSRIKDKRM